MTQAKTALLSLLFVPLLAVFAGSTSGLAQPQANQCSVEFSALTNMQVSYSDAIQAVVLSEENLERAYRRVLSAAHQLSNLRAMIATTDRLLFFTQDPSPQRTTLQKFRTDYEERVKTLNPQAIRARSELLASFDDWTRKSDIATATMERVEQAKNRWAACMANRPRVSASPPPSLRGFVRLVGEVTTNPVGLKPSGGWSWSPEGGRMDFTHPSSGRQSFSWTDPPQQIGPEGAEFTITVESTSNPGGSAMAGMSVKGDFVMTPTAPHVEVRSDKQQLATKSLTVTLKPPPGFSGREMQLIIGADYGPISFIYHYEVIR